MSGEHRPDPPKSAEPVEMTGAYLDYLRSTLLWKIDGLTDDEVRRPGTPSGVSLLALIKHSTYVERSWISYVYAGLEVEFPWTEADPDADWRLEPEDTIAGIVALYEAEAARSREILRGASWDDPAKRNKRGEEYTLGWIMSHMVEEVARHCGHADILREAIDGQTGE